MSKSIYGQIAVDAREKLGKVSPSMCLAKWLQVSMHLTNGMTHSCYHPPVHKIPLDELENNPSALHNTNEKKQQRKMMKEGKRPEGCFYCWKIEDTSGNHLSDRHFRSAEYWAAPYFDEVVNNPYDYDVNPRYVEVNFNQACNLKCSYCSPHLSTTWEQEIEKFGPYPTTLPHNSLTALEKKGLMPLRVKQADNPYVKAFWNWWPDLYKDLRMFRMTGGEPLMDINTFKVLDYVAEYPNKDIEISITSNLCPPDQKLFDKFLNKVQNIIDYKWRIIAIHKIIKLDNPILVYVKNDTHYMIMDETPSNHIKDVFDGKSYNSGSYQKGSQIKFSRMPKSDRFNQYVENIWSIGEIHNPLVLSDSERLYTVRETFKRYVVNKDFYREQQLQDLGCYDFENMTVAEAKSLGFSFVNEDKWWTQKCELLSNNHYSFEFGCEAPSIEHLMLFVSLDSVGEQLEYSRFGANFNVIKSNVEKFLELDKFISVSFINTFNIFSVYKLTDFLSLILELRNKFSIAYQKVWFDIPILHDPKWQSVNNLDNYGLEALNEALDFMKRNAENLFSTKHKGFKDYEIDKLRRNIDWVEKHRPPFDEKEENMYNFYAFFSEYDKRRKTNIVATFPELEEYWDSCKQVWNHKDGLR